LCHAHLFHLFSFSIIRLPPISTHFPYTTLFRSKTKKATKKAATRKSTARATGRATAARTTATTPSRATRDLNVRTTGFEKVKKTDRKSTRLNSSHVKISYAVFCLIKKKKKTISK